MKNFVFLYQNRSKKEDDSNANALREKLSFYFRSDDLNMKF